MSKLIYFINTIPGLEEGFNALVQKYLPDYETKHISDQSLIQNLLKHNGPTPYIYKRLIEHALAAEHSDAVAIQFTCSTISGTAEAIQKFVSIPILTIDAPVMKHAVKKYKRIGLIATNPATLKPSTTSLQTISKQLGYQHKITTALSSDAFTALLKGDKEEHDRLVKKDLLNLMKKVDAVILAQASTARIANTLTKEEKIVPILTSPEPAIKNLAKLIKTLDL